MSRNNDKPMPITPSMQGLDLDLFVVLCRISIARVILRRVVYR